MNPILQLDYKPVQLLLPVDYMEIIDNCDPVVSFREVVGGLNLAKFIKTSRKGRQDYPPEIMLQLVLFGFMQNIRSVRKLEEACKVNIRFMYLAQGIKPSHMAFQRFIDDKLTESLDDIFTVISQFLIEKESIHTETIYVDGTKIEANATKFSFVWKKAVMKFQAKLYLKITQAVKELEKDLGLSLEMKERYEPQDLTPALSSIECRIKQENLQFVYGKGTRKNVLQRYYELLKAYQFKLEEYRDKLEICGDRNSYSKTDHDATFMHGKEDYYNKTGILIKSV